MFGEKRPRFSSQSEEQHAFLEKGKTHVVALLIIQLFVSLILLCNQSWERSQKNHRLANICCINTDFHQLHFKSDHQLSVCFSCNFLETLARSWTNRQGR